MTLCFSQEFYSILEFWLIKTFSGLLTLCLVVLHLAHTTPITQL